MAGLGEYVDEINACKIRYVIQERNDGKCGRVVVGGIILALC